MYMFRISEDGEQRNYNAVKTYIMYTAVRHTYFKNPKTT